MPPSHKGKNGSGDKDKIPINSVQQLLEELKAFKAALLVKETEHTWEALDRAVKRFTAVTRGGGHRYEAEYIAGLKDRELAKAIVGVLATERTQLSASTLLFLSAATRLGPSFAPLLFLYLPHIIRLLSRTNKLYISRATACLTVIIGNTRLAGVIPYLREGMLEKSPTHRKGCMAGLLYALGGPDPLTVNKSSSYEGMLVDKDIVRKRYLDDIETCMRIGTRDKDIEVRKVAKNCWEIYRSEFSERVAGFAAPLTPIARKYLELPPVGQPAPDYSQSLPATSLSKSTSARAPAPASVYAPPAPVVPRSKPLPHPPPPHAPSPVKASSSIQGPPLHTVYRAPARSNLAASTDSNSAHTETRPHVQLSSSLNASQGGPPRPPPTLFARRVLPSSSSVSSSAQTGDKNPAGILRGSTTFASHEPVASTSYSAPILPRSLTSDAIYHQVPAWPAHHRATTAPSASGEPDLQSCSHVQVDVATSRPTSVLSYASSIPSSSVSPLQDFLRPSSSTSSRSTEQNENHTEPAPTEALPGLSAATSSRAVQPQQRRVVPAQVHRAPSRATRRASRVLPPSTDLQAFLSSTATDAASEFKWPAPSSAVSQAVQSNPVDLPIKRPASAMSTASQVSGTFAVGQVERPATSSESHESVNSNLPLAAEKDVASVPPNTIYACPTNANEIAETTNTPATEDDVHLVENRAVKDSTTIHNVTLDRTSEGGATTSLKSVEPETTLSAAIGSQDAAESPKDRRPEVAQLPVPAQMSHSEAVQSDNAIQPPTDVQQLTPVDPRLTVATAPEPAQLMLQPANSLAAELPVVDIAALAAKLSLAQISTLSDGPRPPLAGMRQKTAFRPQKHNKPVGEVPWMPLPTLTASKEEVLLPDSRINAGTSNSNERGQEPTGPVTVQPVVSSYSQNPLKSSIGLSRSQPARLQPPQQVSSNSNPAPQPNRGFNLTRSVHSAHPIIPRETVASTQRGATLNEKNKPPPAKKQALSSSTGHNSGRPVFGGNTLRGAASVSKPVVSAPASRSVASKNGAARQGSIFSRLAAPTAASAGKAKARIPSATRETFKKPAPPSGVLSKKSSTLSLKSSQGPTDYAPRTLKDATNTASRGRAPPGVTEKGVRSFTSEKPQQSTKPEINAGILNSTPSPNDAAPTSQHGVHPEFPSVKPLPMSLEHTAQKELPCQTLLAQADPSGSEQPLYTHGGDSTPLSYPNIAEPQTYLQPQSSNILAELGIESNAIPLPRNAALPLTQSQEVTLENAHIAASDKTPDLSVPEDSTINRSAANVDFNGFSLHPSATFDSTKSTTGPELEETSPMDMPAGSATVEDEELGDQTVIFHDLGSLEGESDIALNAIEEQDSLPASVPEAVVLDSSQGNNTELLPKDDVEVISNNADTPAKTAVQSIVASRRHDVTLMGSHSPMPEEVPLPADLTHPLDPSLSILASPTSSMHDLLARSTGRKAQEEGSPLLLEKEYLPSMGSGQYQYDETVLEAYPSTSTTSTNPVLDGVANEHEKTGDANAVGTQDDEGDDDDEDEIALLISRELSSDSLEELASRWEESRVIGSLGLLDESNDDFDIENTPMRPRLLTRFSDGESSDYGSAPVGTATYTKDDEDAALDILLKMGHQRGTEAEGERTNTILTESLLIPHGQKVQASWRTDSGDRGILAEMSGYADTPKVSRSKQVESTKISATEIQESTSSILREGGIF